MCTESNKENLFNQEKGKLCKLKFVDMYLKLFCTQGSK